MSPKPATPAPRRANPQAGAGVLGVVAMLAGIFVLVQGTLFYRAKASARLQAVEKNKILAQQVAEAGVEENIADLGSRRLRPTPSMSEHVTYAGRTVGAGAFTSTLTTVALGAEADTLELFSRGQVASVSQAVRARLRLRRYMDTTRTPVMEVDIDTVINRFIATRMVDTTVTVVQDPDAMPALNTTAAYAACMASSANKCDVCHIPQGNPANRHVIDISKNAIHTHISHHGDYVTTDGTCDLYNPRPVVTQVSRTFPDSTVTIVDNTTYDTLVVVDTVAKVQVLSWR